MALREISIDELQVGMYVTRLDISWLDSPYLLHQIRIKVTGDIQKLRAAQVRRVVIDPDKAWSSNEAPNTSATAPSAAPPARGKLDGHDVLAMADEASPVSHRPEPPPSHTELMRELTNARQVESQARRVVEMVLNDALLGHDISPSQMTPVIAETVASLSRNDQALMTLMHLERHGGAKQVTHAVGVLSLTLAVGHRLALQRDELDILGLAALLHDVGWTRLPAALFAKGRPYTDAERRLVEQHVTLSKQIIEKSPDMPAAVARLVSLHHERCDGSGYPESVSAKALTAAAQILAVTDEYDRLVHGLLDRPPMHPTAALRYLFVQAKQGQLPAEIVAELVHALGVYPLTSIVRFDTGEIGVVTAINRPLSLLPVVRVCYSAEHQAFQPPLIVDLSKPVDAGPARRITAVLPPDTPGLDPAGLLRIEVPESR